MNNDEAASFPIVFTSLSTILLCFFVYLNTQTVGSSAQSPAIAQSVQKHFGRSPAKQDVEQLSHTFESTTEREIRDLGVTVTRAENRLVVLLPHNVLFLPRSAEVAAGALESFRQLGAVLARQNTVISITNWQEDEGDSSFERTLDQLGAVMRLLIDAGVAVDNLRPIGRPAVAETEATIMISFESRGDGHRERL